MKRMILTFLLFSSLIPVYAEPTFVILLKTKIVEGNTKNSDVLENGKILISENHPGFLPLKGKKHQLDLNLIVKSSSVFSEHPYGVTIEITAKLDEDKKGVSKNIFFKNYQETKTVILDYGDKKKISFDFFIDKQSH